MKVIEDIHEMKEAALHLYTVCKGVKGVLIKGGHLKDEATDVYYDGKDYRLFSARKRFSRDVRGTGCALSSAITAHLARGYTLEKSVERAKEFVTEYIRSEGIGF